MWLIKVIRETEAEGETTAGWAVITTVKHRCAPAGCWQVLTTHTQGRHAAETVALLLAITKYAQRWRKPMVYLRLFNPTKPQLASLAIQGWSPEPLSVCEFQ